MNALRQKIRHAIITAISVWTDVTDLADSTNLIDGPRLESVAILDLIMGIEKTFGIRLDEDSLSVETFSRVSKFIDLIEDKINETKQAAL